MASKLQEYRRMSEEAQRQLTGSLERWQSFLATASRLYKYPYHEQVMIHAQRPDATACAEFDVWNNTMRRYVRRGSKGIALIDTSGDRERLRYVFDVSDTGTRPNSRSLNLWELREEHIPAVSSMLEKNYGVPAGESLAVQLEAVASQLAREYWEDNRRDIYAGYRASGYSKAYYEEHEDAIKLCKASKRAFDELLPSDTSGKTAGSHKKQLPSLKALRAEYAELLAMKKAAYPEYYRSKDEYRELLTYQANLAGLFGIENVRSAPQREHQQEEK